MRSAAVRVLIGATSSKLRRWVTNGVGSAGSGGLEPFTARAGSKAATATDAFRSVGDIWVRIRGAIAVSATSSDVDSRAVADLLSFILCSGDCLIKLAILKLGGFEKVVDNCGARCTAECGNIVFFSAAIRRRERNWQKLAYMETLEKAASTCVAGCLIVAK